VSRYHQELLKPSHVQAGKSVINRTENTDRDEFGGHTLDTFAA